MHDFQKLDNYKNLIDKFCLKNILGHAKMSPQYLMLTVYHLSKKAFCSLIFGIKFFSIKKYMSISMYM